MPPNQRGKAGNDPRAPSVHETPTIVSGGIGAQDAFAGHGLQEAAVGPVDPLVGQLLDNRYRILNPIGAGGMGRIYKANHEFMRRNVAIKFLLEALTTDEDSLLRFIREAQTVGRVRHPHVIEIYDVAQTTEPYGKISMGTVYIAMEFLEGTSLAASILDEGVLPLQRALRIFLQVCKGMEAVHGQGIIHRDLKPDNIFLVDKDGRQDFVKLLDFGIAKIKDAGRDSGVTKAGDTVGTPAYMSPEQAAGAKLDHRSDIYSLGVVLYEMLTGKVPFEGTNPRVLQHAHIHETPVSPCIHNPTIPPQVEAIILRCLQKEPIDRFATVSELKDAIERYLSQSDGPGEEDLTAVRPASPSEASALVAADDLASSSFPPRRGISLPVVAGVAGTLIAAAIAAAFFLTRPKESPSASVKPSAPAVVATPTSPVSPPSSSAVPPAMVEPIAIPVPQNSPPVAEPEPLPVQPDPVPERPSPPRTKQRTSKTSKTPKPGGGEKPPEVIFDPFAPQ